MSGGILLASSRTRIEAFLHLDVKIDTGRSGSCGRGQMRVAVIPREIIRCTGILAPRTGKLHLREQATDNWQAGTDQTNRRLDMRPERRLVNGECGIGWVDPEEHHDTVDTGEADEDTEGKDTVESKFILPRALEVPDHRNGEGKDGEVHDDVEDLVGDKELVLVEALGIEPRIPEAFQRTTLQTTSDDDTHGPGNDESVKGKGDALELGSGEDAAIETDDGCFDGGTQEEV